jgi:tetratricopeptide (TPR) repeat protein
MELMQRAYDRVPLDESEERARLLIQTSHLELLTGDLSKAESDANAALAAFPDYYLAIDALAQVRLAQTRYSDAAVLLRQCYAAVPRVVTLFQLAETEEKAGQNEQSHQSFREFERLALAQSARADNANRELILFYLDHAAQPAKALALARQELAVRQDVYTLDAYAWALAGNGDFTAANAQLKKPLAMGVKDPRLLFHASSIQLHLHAEAAIHDTVK